MEQTTDSIYTMWDYYDGPRMGVTTLHGQPYAYQSLWTDRNGEEDTFLLQPIDQETFHLVLEDWAIWVRWDTALQTGQTTPDTHPALPIDRQRHEELEKVLTLHFRITPNQALRAKLKYLQRDDPTVRRKWQPFPVQ
jgi:hypothetical protein